MMLHQNAPLGPPIAAWMMIGNMHRLNLLDQIKHDIIRLGVSKPKLRDSCALFSRRAMEFR